MIEVSGLTKRYGTINALSNLTFTVGKGQIVGFLGANGAGKTTTMDILCGCIGADQGTAKISGYDITEQPIEAKKRLGYLPDIPPLHLDMKVEDYIEYAAKLRGLSGAKCASAVSNTVEKLSLGEVRKRLVGNLSKGYRQRVALAQAIVHDPEVLVLDEPTEGLDPTQIAQIRQLIKSLAGQHTIILSSHILSEVQNTCDKIIIIHKGKIVQQGTYEQLSNGLENGFLYRIKVARKGSEAEANLRKLTGVQIITSSGDEMEISIDPTNTNLIEEISAKLVQDGHGLREFSPRSKSLEEVFLQITK